MEIPEGKFHEAILVYFEDYVKKRTSGWDRKHVNMIIEGLREVVRQDKSAIYSGGDKPVHLGHVFGPFGFKIK